eukprot:g7105.t1
MGGTRRHIGRWRDQLRSGRPAERCSSHRHESHTHNAINSSKGLHPLMNSSKGLHPLQEPCAGKNVSWSSNHEYTRKAGLIQAFLNAVWQRYVLATDKAWQNRFSEDASNPDPDPLVTMSDVDFQAMPRMAVKVCALFT